LTDNGAASIKRKITDPDLLELMSENPPRAVSVIVELNVPRATVEFEPDRSGAGLRAARVATSDPRQGALREEIAEQAEGLLRDLSGEQPVRLPGGSSLAVRIGSDRLEAIALSPLVNQVQLSRLRR
jgi:hypothetical protein